MWIFQNLNKGTIPEQTKGVGSISAILSCLVYPPREERAGSFPEQQLVIKPTKGVNGDFFNGSVGVSL